jgi:hypothetical protein
MGKWLRAEREGRDLAVEVPRHKPLVKDKPVNKIKFHSYLPVRPMVEMMEAMMRAGDDDTGQVQHICFMAKIGVHTFTEWRSKLRDPEQDDPVVRFDTADRVITNLEVAWFDVWPDDPEAERLFTGGVAA